MTVSWGAHAYLRGLALSNGAALEASTPQEQMLPAYIQYGVHSPEAAIAGLLGVPRQFAEAIGEEFREQHGPIQPESTARLKEYLEGSDQATWNRVVDRSPLSGRIDPDDAWEVWRQIQGLGV